MHQTDGQTWIIWPCNIIKNKCIWSTQLPVYAQTTGNYEHWQQKIILAGPAPNPVKHDYQPSSKSQSNTPLHLLLIVRVPKYRKQWKPAPFPPMTPVHSPHWMPHNHLHWSPPLSHAPSIPNILSSAKPHIRLRCVYNFILIFLAIGACAHTMIGQRQSRVIRTSLAITS